MSARVRLFDEETVKKAQELLRKAEKLVMRYLNIDEKTWNDLYKQVYRPMDASAIRDFRRTYVDAAHRKGIVRVVRNKDDYYQKKGKLARCYEIPVDEDSLLRIREEKGEEYFECQLLYVFTHELQHMLDVIKIDELKSQIRELELKWADESRAHKTTIKIFEGCEEYPKVKEQILGVYKRL